MTTPQTNQRLNWDELRFARSVLYRWDDVSMKLLSSALLLLCLYPTKTVYAHGFGERYDLPVPLWLYIWGAAAVVLISFLAMIRFLKRPKDQALLDKLFTVPPVVTRIALHNCLGRTLEVIGVAIFLGVVVAGVIGSANPNYNIAPTLVWVIWWVGFVYLTALIGNAWSIVNPWSSMFQGAEKLFYMLQVSLAELGPTLQIFRRLEKTECLIGY